MTHTIRVIIETFSKAQDFDHSGFHVNVSTLFINIKTQEP